MTGRPDTATKSATRVLAILAVVACTACRPAAAVSDDAGAKAAPAATEADRAALFDFLVESTLAWDAFASLPEHPYYRAHPKGLDVRAEMQRYRQQLLSADTDEKLWYALWAISNARRDRHLQVGTVPGGLVLPAHVRRHVAAPVRFEADFGDERDRFFFVADVGVDIERVARGAAPSPGDRLVAVNRRTAAEYAAAMRPYQRYSTEHGYWWRLADEINRTSEYVPHAEFYGDSLVLELERRDGARYRVTLPYLAPSGIRWRGHGARAYPGFHHVGEVAGFETLDVYRPDDERLPVVLLQWHGFLPDLPAAMDRLMEYAQAQRLLDHHVIVDATYSRGGSRGAYAVQRLQPRPFRTTFGNLKVSEAMERWVAEQVRSLRADPAAARETVDGGRWLLDWLETDVRDAIAAGQRYTSSVPFKGAHLPKWADGIIDPAPVHFRGRLTVWLSGRGGSHLDQFAAQVVDNDLGHVMGMPAGGFSNTWQTTEVLRYPTTGRPIVSYQWSLGHSLRPNGEILQYNPAAVHEPIPQTRDNYFDYHARLLRRTLQRLDIVAGVDAAAARR
jgi:hypothetical protein